MRETNIVLSKIFYPATISGRQQHDLALEPPLGCITSNWLYSSRNNRFVVCADPGRRALVRHLPSKVSMDGLQQLVVQMDLFSIGTVQYWVDPFRVFRLVKATCPASKLQE